MRPLAIAAALAGAAAPVPARANQNETWIAKTTTSPEPARESWAGAEAFARVLSLYSGATLAPFGSLRQDGVRLRVVGGTSTYAYEGRRFVSAAGDASNLEFRGRGTFIEALAGYQWSTGPTTVKAFAGYIATGHDITPYDTETVIQGRAGGPKAVIEIWHNLADLGYLALDLAYARPYGGHSERARFGARVTEAWSLGPELQRIGHDEGTTMRMGAFVRFEGPKQEASVSFGSSVYKDGQPQTYVTAQWLVRF